MPLTNDDLSPFGREMVSDSLLSGVVVRVERGVATEEGTNDVLELLTFPEGEKVAIWKSATLESLFNGDDSKGWPGIAAGDCLRIMREGVKRGRKQFWMFRYELHSPHRGELPPWAEGDARKGVRAYILKVAGLKRLPAKKGDVQGTTANPWGLPAPQDQ